MDPQSTTPETTPLEPEATEEKKLFQSPEQIQEPVVETPSVNTSFDPKLLASHLEDSRTDDTNPSAQVFHQALQGDTQTSPQQPHQVQVIEKIVYKKQRVHWFFRTLTLLALLFVGILMLLEGLWLFALNIGGVSMNTFYPVFIILSVIIIRSYRGIFGKIFGLLMFLSIVAGFFILWVYSSLTPSTKNATWSTISFPLHSGHVYSKVYVSTLLDELHIDGQTGSTLMDAQYDTERPMILFSWDIQSGHNYAILEESSKINLLERVFTRLQVWLNEKQPTYLYVKTLLGQDNLDMSSVNLRGLRIHGGVLSLDAILWSWMSSTWLVTTWVVSKINLDLQAAVADVTLHLPKDMGVRLYYKSYIGRTELTGFTQNDKTDFVSNNLKKSTSILDINAVFGLSRFTILWDR